MNKEILDKAIDLLSRQEYSVKELVEKLKSRDFDGDEISMVITYLLDNDYLSEADIPRV